MILLKNLVRVEGVEPPIPKASGLKPDVYAIPPHPLGADGPDRTGNLLITSELLFQLSYTGIKDSIHNLLLKIKGVSAPKYERLTIPIKFCMVSILGVTKER